MAIEIRVPTLGESVTRATVGQWFKKAGDNVKVDEPLCELETDKVTVEVPAPAAGVLAEIRVEKGTTVAVGALLGAIKEGAGGNAALSSAPASAPAAAVAVAAPAEKASPAATAPTSMPPSPAARKALEEAGLTSADVAGSGKRGQVLKEDVVNAVARPAPAAAPVAYASVPALAPQQLRVPSAPNDAAREERVR